MFFFLFIAAALPALIVNSIVLALTDSMLLAIIAIVPIVVSEVWWLDNQDFWDDL
jgi:hypothetical protein